MDPLPVPKPSRGSTFPRANPQSAVENEPARRWQQPCRLVGRSLPAAISLCAPACLSAQEADPKEPVEIIVTGERVPRTLFDTPSSVVALTGEDLAARSASDRIDQLLALVPNVQVGSGGEGVAIRGQDSTGVLNALAAGLGGAKPRVTLQVDGRPLGYFEYVFGAASTWDVAQVEIFRSPQTTTQGRNSIAGAIFVRTEDPAGQWEARVRAISGNYGSWQGSAVVAGPIAGDALSLRVSGDIRTMRNSSEMFDGIAGASLDRDEFGVLRAKLLARPAAIPGLKITATYAHGESQAPQFEALYPPFKARRVPVAEPTNGVFLVNSDSLTGVADYEMAQGLVWRTTLSTGDAKIDRFGLPGLGRVAVASRDRMVETTLNWTGNPVLHMIGGVYYLRQRQRQSIDLTAQRNGTGDFRDRQRSLGLFGEATWHPVPALALTGGLRYQRDGQDREGILRRPAAPLPVDYDRVFEAWLPKFTIAYEVDPDLTLGLMAQRAFNPGGMTIVTLLAKVDEFGAETLWNYEAFLRARFDGGRGTISANLFYNDISDAQRTYAHPVTPPIGPPVVAVEFVNQPAAKSYGAEIEASWSPGGRLRLNAGIGLLKTRILETAAPDDATLGKQFARSPRLSISAGIDWRPLDRLRLSAQLRANSGYYSDDANTPALRIAGSTVVNARAAYIWRGITIFGYARNLFDRFYMTYLFPPLGPRPAFGTAGDPREVGLGIEAAF